MQYFLNKVLRFLNDPKPFFKARYATYLQKRSKFISKICPFSLLDDKYFLEYHFFTKLGYKLNLKNPQTFNEKLQWIKLYFRNPLYTTLADKYAVRTYVEEKIGSSYLVKLLAVHEDATGIDWDALPERFVIKTTHGSGWNIICKDKSQLDISEATNRLIGWLKTNGYKQGGVSREWQYKDIIPRIIIEEYLEGDNKYGLLDYKIYCYSGTPEFIEVHFDRFSGHRVLIFDKFWNKPDIHDILPSPVMQFERPFFLDEMLEISMKLSKGIPFCRVDLYGFNEQIYFGEITLCPSGGFGVTASYESDLLLGKPLVLPKKI